MNDLVDHVKSLRESIDLTEVFESEPDTEMACCSASLS